MTNYRKFKHIDIYHYNFPEENLDFHHHSEAQIIIPILGKTTLSFDQQRLEDCQLEPGKIGIIPPLIDHCFIAPKQRDNHGERLVCYFGKEEWNKYFDSKIKAGIYQLNPLLKEILFYLLLTPESKHTNEILKTFLLILNESIASNVWVKINLNVNDPKIMKAITFVEKNFAKKISIEDLSKFCGLGQRDLNRKFIKLVNVTPKKLQTHLRINFAIKLLKSKRFSVTEVSFEVGYQSVSQFIQAFREETGKLPTEFRLTN